MIHKTYQFEFRQLGLTITQVQNDMGYREEAPDSSVLYVISDVLKDCESLNNIRAEYRIFHNISFDQAEKTVRIDDIVFRVHVSPMKSCG